MIINNFLKYYCKRWPGYIGYKLGIRPLPYYCILAVTYDCNSRCNMCNFWKRKHPGEITVEQIERIFSGSLFRRLTKFTLTGGEPCLREDLSEIIEVIYKLTGLRPDMGTNGLLPEKLDQVLSRGRDKLSGVCISVDGLKNTHNKIRGRDDAFDLALESLKIVESHGLKPDVSMTVSRGNYQEVNDVYLYFKSIFSDFGFNYKVAQESQYYFGSNKGTVRYLEEDEVKQLLEGTKKILDRNLYNLFLEDWLLQGVRPTPCYAGSAALYISSNGKMHPCIHKPALGSLKEESAADIWFSKKARSFRKEHKSCQDCYERCSVETFNIDYPKWAIKAKLQNRRKGDSRVKS